MLEKNLVLNNGLLKKVEINGIEFENFSIEFSDKFSFFTLAEKSRFVISNLVKSENKNNYSKALYTIQTIQGHFELEVSTTVNANKNFIDIEAQLKPLDDVFVQDFVIRMKAKKSNITNILIENSNIKHNDTQKYYQFKTNNLTINSIDKKKIKINRLSDVKLDGAENHIYVRDLKEFWIIHSRLFPSKKPNQYNLRWITSYFWISLGHKISKIISNIPFFGKVLWYRKERLGKKALEIQLIGLIKFAKNTKIKQKVRIEYNGANN